MRNHLNPKTLRAGSDSQMTAEKTGLRYSLPDLWNLWKRITGFDLFVMAGAMVNLIIICYLLVYWLTHAGLSN